MTGQVAGAPQPVLAAAVALQPIGRGCTQDQFTQLYALNEESPAKYKNDRTLREYQVKGVNWLLWSWCQRRSVILETRWDWGRPHRSKETATAAAAQQQHQHSIICSSTSHHSPLLFLSLRRRLRCLNSSTRQWESKGPFLLSLLSRPWRIGRGV